METDSFKGLGISQKSKNDRRKGWPNHRHSSAGRERPYGSKVFPVGEAQLAKIGFFLQHIHMRGR